MDIKRHRMGKTKILPTIQSSSSSSSSSSSISLHSYLHSPGEIKDTQRHRHTHTRIMWMQRTVLHLFLPLHLHLPFHPFVFSSSSFNYSLLTIHWNHLLNSFDWWSISIIYKWKSKRVHFIIQYFRLFYLFSFLFYSHP